MADAGFYSTLVLVKYKAGANASATSTGQAYIDQYLFEAESFINVASGKIWAISAAAYAALPWGTRGLLCEAASSLAAIQCINYDMSGFTSRAEAELMINVLYQRAMDCIKLLSKEASSTKFMTSGI